MYMAPDASAPTHATRPFPASASIKRLGPRTSSSSAGETEVSSERAPSTGALANPQHPALALLHLSHDDPPRLVVYAQVANAHRRRRSKEPQSRQLAAAGAASGPIQDPSSWNWRHCARSGVWRRSAPSGFRRPYRPPNVALGRAVEDPLSDLVSVALRRFGRLQLGGEAHAGWRCWGRPSPALAGSRPTDICPGVLFGVKSSWWQVE